MSATDRSLLVPAAVYVGALVLVGLPTTALVSSTLGTAIRAIGLGGVLESGGYLVVLAVSLLIGLQFAFEIAAIQFGGIEALDRGSPRVALARKLGSVASAVVALAAATRVALSAAVGGYGPVIVALALLVISAVVFVGYRSVHGFLAGLRSETA